MQRIRFAAATLAVGLLAPHTGAQDFHFISTRDSAPDELNFEIYRYQNGAQTRITTTGVIEEHPVLATAGPIYCRGLGPEGVGEIITVDPIFGIPNQLTFDGATDGRAGNNHPFLAPDEASLFITTHIEDGTSVVRRIDLNGNELGVVVDHGAHVGHSPAATTPEGDKLYYSSDQDGDFELYRSNLDGSNEQQLTTNGLYDAGVVPSPNGNRIAFTREDPLDACTTHIWVMDHNGANATQVTDSLVGGNKWPFGWDGTNILYVSNQGGDNAIYAIGQDGLNEQLLIDSPGADQHLLPDALCGVNLPEVELELLPPIGLPGLPVDMELHTHGQPYVSYEWTFGDGNVAVTNQPDVGHIYNAPGDYVVTCTAIDTCNNRKVADTFVEIIQPQFPGTQDDLILWTGINAQPDPIDLKITLPGDQLELFLDSPGGTFHGNFGFLGIQVFPTGFPPPEPLPGLFLGFGPGFLWAIPPAATPPLLPGGNPLSLPIPPDPSLTGFDMMLQSLVLDPQASNGVFATSDGKVLRFP